MKGIKYNQCIVINMAETHISSKYTLKPEQMNAIIDAFQDNSKKVTVKTHWQVVALNIKDEKGYPVQIRSNENIKVPFLDCCTPFSMTFPEGYLAEGTELKLTVGDWNVLDGEGKHCMQSFFFYIDGQGNAIPCKYKELPSQGGAVPTAPAQQTLGVPTSLTGVPSLGMVQTPAPAFGGFGVAKEPVKTEFFICKNPAMAEDPIHPAEDYCSQYEGIDNDKHCETCPNGKRLVYFD